MTKGAARPWRAQRFKQLRERVARVSDDQQRLARGPSCQRFIDEHRRGLARTRSDEIRFARRKRQGVVACLVDARDPRDGDAAVANDASAHAIGQLVQRAQHALGLDARRRSGLFRNVERLFDVAGDVDAAVADAFARQHQL